MTEFYLKHHTDIKNLLASIHGERRDFKIIQKAWKAWKAFKFITICWKDIITCCNNYACSKWRTEQFYEWKELKRNIKRNDRWAFLFWNFTPKCFLLFQKVSTKSASFRCSKLFTSFSCRSCLPKKFKFCYFTMFSIWLNAAEEQNSDQQCYGKRSRLNFILLCCATNIISFICIVFTFQIGFCYANYLETNSKLFIFRFTLSLRCFQSSRGKEGMKCNWKLIFCKSQIKAQAVLDLFFLLYFYRARMKNGCCENLTAFQLNYTCSLTAQWKKNKKRSFCEFYAFFKKKEAKKNIFLTILYFSFRWQFQRTFEILLMLNLCKIE